MVADIDNQTRSQAGKNIHAEMGKRYQVRAYRFSSVTSSEGLMLDQLEQPAFASALREKIGQFRFEKQPPVQTTPEWVGIPAGLAVSVVLGMVLKRRPKPLGTFPLVLICLVCFLLIVAVALNITNRQRMEGLQRERKAYIEQLNAYLVQLLSVCDQYGID